MSKSRFFTLLANILNTFTTVIMVIFAYSRISFIRSFVQGMAQAQNQSLSGNSINIRVNSFIGAIILIGIIGMVLGWFAFIKIDTEYQKFWTTLPLVLGILSIFPGMFFTFFTSIISGMLFILAFIFGKKEINQQKTTQDINKESFNFFASSAKPEEKPDIKKFVVRNKFLVIVQLFIIFCLEAIPQIFIENFKNNDLKNHTSFSLLQTLITIAVMVLIIFLVILWGRKVAKVKWSFFGITKNLSVIGLGFVGTFILEIFGNNISTLLNGGATVISKNQQGLNSMMHNIPLFLFWFMAAVSAPIIEETVFRVGFFEFLFREHTLLAWFIGAVFFGLIHTYSDLTHFPSYFFMGIAFGWVYWKTRRVEASATLHFLWNTMVILMGIL